jgi:hypothetical protein
MGVPGQWQVVTPRAEWQSMPNPHGRDGLAVPTDLYYVNVAKR